MRRRNPKSNSIEIKSSEHLGFVRGGDAESEEISTTPGFRLLTNFAFLRHRRYVAVLVGTALVAMYLIDRCIHIVNTKRREKLRAYHETLKFGNVTAIEEFYHHDMILSNCKAPTTTTIFYNVFVPFNNRDHAFAILAEQLGAISSFFMGQAPPEINVVTIGFDGTMQYIENQLCSNLHLSCRHLGHYEEADEGVTLQALQDHCHTVQDIQSSNNHYVTYLHSKGSFHPSPQNDRWRRLLTHAALAPCCCDVCGLQFYTQFVPMFPGNMWTASCRYVRTLVPPLSYNKTTAVVEQLLLLNAQGVLQSELLRKDRIDYWGVDRYQYEHWIAGHPALLHPCERLPAQVTLQDVVLQDTPTRELQQLYRAPQRPGFCVGNVWEAHEHLWHHPPARYREMWLLPGRLAQAELLYGQLPPEDSWMWRWYPDGAFWKRAVLEQGSVIAALRKVNHVPEQPFTSEKRRDVVLTVSVMEQAVFVHDPFGDGPMQNAASLQHVVSTLGRNIPNITLYGIVENEQRRDVLCGGERYSINCDFISVTQQDDGHYPAGDTLALVYQYCRQAPLDSTVVYVDSSMESLNPPMACINKLRTRRATCNICLWDNTAWDGRSFAAQCSYVQELLDPNSVYPAKMLETTGRILLASLRQQLLTETAPESLVSEHEWTRHWILSHPSAHPCSLPDLSPLPVQESFRIRSDKYLAGKILRWYGLYRTIPEESSWVWSYYPDGASKWLPALQTYGPEGALQHLASELSGQSYRDSTTN